MAALLMLEMWRLEHEVLRTVLLNTKNVVLGTPTLYQGSVNQLSLRVGELFREAIRQNALGVGQCPLDQAHAKRQGHDAHPPSPQLTLLRAPGYTGADVGGPR